MPYWLQAVILFLAANVLFRISGKNSISSMRVDEVVIMIGLASVLVEPLKSKNLWICIYVGAILILLMLSMTYLEIFFPRLKRWVMGEPIVLIKNGEINHQNLKRARMTVDELKMRIRAEKIIDISQIRFATLEASGRLGLDMDPEYAAATKKDIEDLKQAIQLIGSRLNAAVQYTIPSTNPEKNLFIQADEMQEQDPLQ
ncbi:DUF421 domain-containing protein [Brevibacillus fluminis]|uniref:DUF421 domain-containing protein n=1 Tax=Brevibacillus fluminis TaxID=511487 RepID=A0A3M8CXP3_9BACL|nr:YetF domain-containing protein [Brevibacillus fluminis]RNB80209.1 DUF421 domain-containing protein [Brevibacillus fluminis]